MITTIIAVVTSEQGIMANLITIIVITLHTKIELPTIPGLNRAIASIKLDMTQELT